MKNIEVRRNNLHNTQNIPNEIWQEHVIGEIYSINQLWNDQVYKANKNDKTNNINAYKCFQKFRRRPQNIVYI